ncbi:MAG: hypothetical protein IKM27_02435 [Clostridia bacterium]|nr:hypothetical protein [Clostridia bacterium]
MGLFSRKNKPPKDTSSVEFKRYMANRISDKLIKCVLERNEDYTDTIIGKSGFFVVKDGLLEIITGSDTVLCGEIDTLTIWELLSLDGVVITGYDRTVDRERTVMAYYKYYREVK